MTENFYDKMDAIIKKGLDSQGADAEYFSVGTSRIIRETPVQERTRLSVALEKTLAKPVRAINSSSKSMTVIGYGSGCYDTAGRTDLIRIRKNKFKYIEDCC